MDIFENFSALFVEVWDKGILGIDIFQILIGLGIFLIFLLFRGLISKVIINRLKKIAKKTTNKLDDTFVQAMEGPARFFPIVIGFFIASYYLEFSPESQSFINNVNKSLITILIFWLIHQFVQPVSYLLGGLEKLLTKELIGWIIKALKILIFILGAAAVLELWGIKIGPIIAGLGLFGVAVALGAQDLFKNLISGILVLVEKRFKVGDWIIVEEIIEGIVERIGFRSTVVRKFDKSLAIIPNFQFAENAVVNISATTNWIISWVITLQYNTTVDQLKKITDEALVNCPNVKKCIVVKRTGNEVNWVEDRDIWYDDITKTAANHCKPEEMNAEDPLFILYTSGSTGKPKGVLHTTGGYMVYASMTHQYIFDYKKNDIYWCSADIGWVTGHSYIIYGPLSNGATTIMFEGIPNYPDTSRWWQIVDKYKVNIFYTAPTALRALMKEGEAPVKKTSRKSLKLLGTVGEPINPEAWLWYYKVIGDSRCPIVDTWWQTETGGILISPQPGAIDLKPGSATKPFYGIKPVIVDEKGKTLKGACRGRLCIAQSWPGQMRTVYGDHQRFIDTYFSQFDGKYFTGDGCRRDEDGYYWITGRVDDVIIVSGHNLGTAELESAFVAHPKVAEAAVVGYPHDIKGNGLYCYVTLNAGEKFSGELERDLKLWVRKQIGPIATPDIIQFAPSLPKTRSGKIMRRILRKIAANEHEQLGDTTTLADPSVVKSLVENRKNK